MDQYRTLHEQLRALSGAQRTIAIYQGVVNSVSGCTCEVQIGSIAIPDVRLRASLTDDSGQMLITPKVGSAVTVGSLSGDLADLVVLQIDHAETVIINGGKLGGLINIRSLTDKINELVKAFNNHTHQATVVHPGGTFVTMKPGSSAAQFSASDYEDTKVKH